MIHTQSGRAFYAGLLEALVQVMGSAKGYLVDHGPRVAILAAQLADRMGLPEEEVSRIFFASVLSDMGMVGLAEDAWENPVPELPERSRARVEEHPVRSEDRVRGIPHLEELAPLVRHHHEWWNGSGYPDGLQGEEIPIGARILRLADTVTALGQRRPHRGPLGRDEIRAVVEAGVGAEFGPRVARTWLALGRNREIAAFEPNVFRHAVGQAAGHLLPEEVSPLSGGQLLSIVANLIDAKDPYTAGHSRRVATLSVAVAEQLGLEDRLGSTLWAGGYLHDLGKLRVPLRILAKKGQLTEDEYRIVQRHPSDGAAILQAIPSLEHLTTGARYHHERWDGGGYPEGLRENHIPLVAQIMAVCDAYDAMTSRRAYRDCRTHRDALEEIHRSTGTHFSPRVTDAFLGIDQDVFLRAQHPADDRGAGRPSAPSPRVRRVRSARKVAGG